MIKVVNDLKTADLELAAQIKFTYEDLVHFLGEPTDVVGKDDRRVEWQLYEEGYGEGEEPVRATIYDSDQTMQVGQNFIWYIGGHCSRSFEIVAEYINELRMQGKDFLSKALEGEENKGKTENYQVSMDNNAENGNDGQPN